MLFASHDTQRSQRSLGVNHSRVNQNEPVQSGPKQNGTNQMSRVKPEGFRQMVLNNSPLYLAVLFLSAGIAQADSRPTIPAMGYDLKLTQGVPVKEFFAKRLKDQSCQSELAAAKAHYASSHKQLQDLIAHNASGESIDSAESSMDKSRLNYLAKVKVCGPCATQPLEKRTVVTTKKEVWYITDGSCFVGSTLDANQLDSYYERGVEILRNLRRYPRHVGGFNAILDFQAVNMTTGEISPAAEKLETTPYFSFIAVKGPSPFGLLSTAFSYVFRNDIGEKKMGDLKEFSIQFTSVPAPEGFVTPDISITSASGQKSGTMARELKLVQGMWYLNNQGYFRYYTAADFGMKVPFADSFAINTLLDTVLQLSERSTAAE